MNDIHDIHDIHGKINYHVNTCEIKVTQVTHDNQVSANQVIYQPVNQVIYQPVNQVIYPNQVICQSVNNNVNGM